MDINVMPISGVMLGASRSGGNPSYKKRERRTFLGVMETLCDQLDSKAATPHSVPQTLAGSRVVHKVDMSDYSAREERMHWDGEGLPVPA